MGYKRPDPPSPTVDEIAAVNFMRRRLREIGIVTTTTDSQFRRRLYYFIETRMAAGVWYQSVLEAAHDCWKQDEPIFKVYALLLKICEGKINAKLPLAVE